MKRLPLLILLVCGGGFVFGLIELFVLRFEAGDVYPPYSSLRADPLGTRAFFESLDHLHGLSLRRDFSSENQLPPGKETTYLHLAAERNDWTFLPEETFREIENFLGRGGRLVITFFPENYSSAKFIGMRGLAGGPGGPKGAKPLGKSTPSGSSPKNKKRQNKTDDNSQPVMVSPAERWGIDFGTVGLARNENGISLPATVRNETELDLPPSLNWHSSMIFTNLEPSWQTIYARGTNPVVVERFFGPGSVVMATDSFFVSNEALTKERHADLLAWLVGAGKNVVFDEAHLGLVETSGIAALMKKYRLYWLAAALLGLAILFVWRNSSSFLPPFSDEGQVELVTGKDSSAGFVNLLRRNLPAREILELCFAEWTKSLTHAGYHTIARVDQAQAVLEAERKRDRRERDPVKAYQEICKVLNTSSKKREQQ